MAWLSGWRRETFVGGSERWLAIGRSKTLACSGGGGGGGGGSGGGGGGRRAAACNKQAENIKGSLLRDGGGNRIGAI